jgi:hypothetical protein
MKKVFGMLMSAKTELSDLEYEQLHDMIGFLYSISRLKGQRKLRNAINCTLLSPHY